MIEFCQAGIQAWYTLQFGGGEEERHAISIIPLYFFFLGRTLDGGERRGRREEKEEEWGVRGEGRGEMCKMVDVGGLKLAVGS